MAAVCELCGKHPSWGMSVSHSHRRTKRRWNPNVQRVRALVNGTTKRVYVCTGVIKSYDPGSGDGVVVSDTTLKDYDLAADALVGSLFRMLRQGQRVIFDLNADDQATSLRLGSEVDMATPGS